MSAQQNAPDGKSGAVNVAQQGAGTLSLIDQTSVGTGGADVAPADYRQATSAWARAQIRAFAGAGPLVEYGTREWLDLPDRDPRRYAAVIVAAEQARPPREDADRARCRQTPPPRPWPLQATPGWPPVRVPGAPGIYLVPTSSHLVPDEADQPGRPS